MLLKMQHEQQVRLQLQEQIVNSSRNKKLILRNEFFLYKYKQLYKFTNYTK